MTHREAALWAERFWRLAGQTEPFPRNLESSVAWALPLAVFKLPHLGLSTLKDWLWQRRIRLDTGGPDRRLRAFLMARAGRGLVVLEGSDPENERRFSLAHEASHFLADYMYPRVKALELLGPGGAEVLDGLRPPTTEERLMGVLRGVETGIYTHLMERPPEGDVSRFEILDAEDRADRIGLELLAPREEVLRQLAASGVGRHDASALSAASEILVVKFGLPLPIARDYGRHLLTSLSLRRSFREWLGVG